MILLPGYALQEGERLVARRCFTHPEFGNVHVGNVFESLVEVIIRNEGDMLHVRRISTKMEAQMAASDLRLELWHG